MTAAEREDAYSPSTMVGGDLGRFIASYAEQSRAAYATCPDLQTLHYGQAETQTLDLVVPQGAGPHPLHVFVHGGYWQALSKKESFFAAPGTLAQGIAFSAVDYTLAPGAALGEIVDEVISAIRFLIMQSDAYGLDPTRVVISGSSAGAHLAAMATLRLGASERPAGLMLLSGIYDLRPLVGTYINDAIGMDDKSAAALSPALCDLSGFPPSVVAWGDNETDEFKRQSLHFAELLQQAGCATDTREVAGRNHFDIVHDIASDSALGGWLARLARPKEH
ncbi:alpha/beta hydrolase [Sulfitobacter sp. TSTF-M16]|uniref:Alpha/beta hydrolase n=2 Tax=Sulfitobacter aestuariivivens TaxID=2766981 RepID=A0A927D434_9RHOB|nr:alpha/beta hydrolase [Sulfitobacter aestuariivivens]